VTHLRLLEGDHDGFAVDRLTHCLQTAARAEKAGRSDEYLLCALIHDIGDTLGPWNHADVAASILAPFVAPELHWMVAHHGEFQGYYFFHFLGQDGDRRERYRGEPNSTARPNSAPTSTRWHSTRITRHRRSSTICR
jgi:predicted HD phosphohydrolase